MFKSLISTIIQDIALPLLSLLAGVFFITFFPDYWGRLTLITIAVIVVALIKLNSKYGM